jgi:hypothetical protein
VRELSGEAILLNVKTSMYLQIPNNVRRTELYVDDSDCTADTFQCLTLRARRPTQADWKLGPVPSGNPARLVPGAYYIRVDSSLLGLGCGTISVTAIRHASLKITVL